MGERRGKILFYSILLDLMTWTLQSKLTKDKPIGRKVHYVHIGRPPNRRNEDSEAVRPRAGKMGIGLTYHLNNE